MKSLFTTNGKNPTSEGLQQTEIRSDDYWNIRDAEVEFQRRLDRLVSHRQRALTPQTINAYYKPYNE